MSYEITIAMSTPTKLYKSSLCEKQFALDWQNTGSGSDSFISLGPLSATVINITSTVTRVWKNEYIYVKRWDVIIYPHPNLNGTPAEHKHKRMIIFRIKL